MMDEGIKAVGRVAMAVIFIGIIVSIRFLMWGMPVYRVWQRELAGKAEFKQAEWNRRIAIKEAEAKMESSKFLAMAEVERAKGVAEANKIIGESLQGNETYLHYLWIHGLQESTSDVIYVPTETNLPILEATRFNQRTLKKPIVINAELRDGAYTTPDCSRS